MSPPQGPLEEGWIKRELDKEKTWPSVAFFHLQENICPVRDTRMQISVRHIQSARSNPVWPGFCHTCDSSTQSGMTRWTPAARYKINPYHVDVCPEGPYGTCGCRRADMKLLNVIDCDLFQKHAQIHTPSALSQNVEDLLAASFKWLIARQIRTRREAARVSVTEKTTDSGNTNIGFKLCVLKEWCVSNVSRIWLRVVLTLW